MEYLSELDDCINNLEQLQLTIDVDTPTSPLGSLCPTGSPSSPAISTGSDLEQHKVINRRLNSLPYNNVPVTSIQFQDFPSSAPYQSRTLTPQLSANHHGYRGLSSLSGGSTTITNINHSNIKIQQHSPVIVEDIRSPNSGIDCPDFQSVTVHRQKLQPSSDSSPIHKTVNEQHQQPQLQPGSLNQPYCIEPVQPQHQHQLQNQMSATSLEDGSPGMADFPPPPPPLVTVASLDPDNYLVPPSSSHSSPYNSNQNNSNITLQSPSYNSQYTTNSPQSPVFSKPQFTNQYSAASLKQPQQPLYNTNNNGQYNLQQQQQAQWKEAYQVQQQPQSPPVSATNVLHQPSSTAAVASQSSQIHKTVTNNSLKLSPKMPMEPFSVASTNSSQSNISSSIDKESKTVKSPMKIDTMSTSIENSAKTVVRFFCADKTTKALMIDESMTVEIVICTLMEKNFLSVGLLKSAVVEKVPSLKMERFMEEHEYLLDCINSWPKTCGNMIFFEQREDIYGLFEQPKMFLGENYVVGAMSVEDMKKLYFSVSGNHHEYQDYLYMKKPGENAWKRKFCVLRADGIFSIPKKKSRSQKEVTVMLFNDKYHLYTTTGGWTKEWNAPTPFGFAFKPYSIIEPRSDQVLLFCAADECSMKRWCSNLRLCKHKHQIVINYERKRPRYVYSDASTMGGSSMMDLHGGNTPLSPASSTAGSSSRLLYGSLARCSLPTNNLGAPCTASSSTLSRRYNGTGGQVGTNKFSFS